MGRESARSWTRCSRNCKGSQKGYKSDTDLTADDLKQLVEDFKAKVKEVLGKPFPQDPMEQLWGAIGAVFASWMGKRAVEYRRIEAHPR
jgi:pyruvate,orthophosphate dikinase